MPPPSSESRSGRSGLSGAHILRRDRVRLARRHHAAGLEFREASGRIGGFRVELPPGLLLPGLRRLPRHLHTEVHTYTYNNAAVLKNQIPTYKLLESAPLQKTNKHISTNSVQYTWDIVPSKCGWRFWLSTSHGEQSSHTTKKSLRPHLAG